MKWSVVPIRGHRLEPELDAAVRATVHQALLLRSEKRHAATSSGFDPGVHKLTVAKTTKRFITNGLGIYKLCVWTWLSDGSRYRAAWRLLEAHEGMKGAYERTEWPYPHRQPQYTTVARRRKPKSKG